MTTYADFTSTHVLIKTDLDNDNNPVVITKDVTTGALNIAGKLQVDNSTLDLANLDANDVPTAKNVSDALAVFSSADASTLATLQAINAEFTTGGDVATAIAAIANQASTITSIQSTQSSQASTLSSIQSTQSSQASTLSSANSNISSLQSTQLSQATTLSTLGGNVSTLQSTVASQASAISSISSQAANVVAITPPVGGEGPGTITIGTGSGVTLTWNVTYRTA